MIKTIFPPKDILNKMKVAFYVKILVKCVGTKDLYSKFIRDLTTR